MREVLSSTTPETAAKRAAFLEALLSGKTWEFTAGDLPGLPDTHGHEARSMKDLRSLLRNLAERAGFQAVISNPDDARRCGDRLYVRCWKKPAPLRSGVSWEQLRDDGFQESPKSSDNWKDMQFVVDGQVLMQATFVLAQGSSGTPSWSTFGKLLWGDELVPRDIYDVHRLKERVLKVHAANQGSTPQGTT